MPDSVESPAPLRTTAPPRPISSTRSPSIGGAVAVAIGPLSYAGSSTAAGPGRPRSGGSGRPRSEQHPGDGLGDAGHGGRALDLDVDAVRDDELGAAGHVG